MNTENKEWIVSEIRSMSSRYPKFKKFGKETASRFDSMSDREAFLYFSGLMCGYQRGYRDGSDSDSDE